MKKLLCGAVMTVLLAGGLVGYAQAGPDEDAIARLMNQDLAAGWKQNDPGKVLDIYAAEEPIVWVDVDKNAMAKLTTSKEDRKKALQEFFSKIRVVEFVVGNIEVTKISDNLALVTTTEKVTFMEKDAKEENQMTLKGVYEVIKQKDGKWRAQRELSIVADAEN